MGLNKKQKKQLEVAKKKLAGLRQLLTDLKKQPDDPDEITKTEEQIEKLLDDIKKIQGDG